jgi:RNA polymerase sigma-70 factor, ECF subfamily
MTVTSPTAPCEAPRRSESIAAPASIFEVHSEPLAGRRPFEVRPSTRLTAAWHQKLFAGLQKNDPPAMAIFFRRYARTIYRIGLGILKSPVEAEDFLQDMIVHFALHAEAFDPRQSTVRAWVQFVTLRKAITRGRMLRTRRKIFGRPSDSLRFWPERSNFFDPITQSLDAEKLLASSSLSPRQLRVLHLMVAEGMTLREIASEIGESHGNARHDYYRALEKMRRTASQLPSEPAGSAHLPRASSPGDRPH